MIIHPLIFTPCSDSAARLLVVSDMNVRMQTALRSGLYIITTSEQTWGTRQIFVVYWLEQTTRDDSATPSVGRSRIMFMRFAPIDTIRKITDLNINLAQVPDEDA